jgi:hypothetical protein
MMVAIILYCVLILTFIYLSPCNQRGTYVFDINIAYSCAKNIRTLTYCFLAFCALLLYFINKKDNQFFNKKGVVFCMLSLLFLIPVLYILSLVNIF